MAFRTFTLHLGSLPRALDREEVKDVHFAFPPRESFDFVAPSETQVQVLRCLVCSPVSKHGIYHSRLSPELPNAAATAEPVWE